MEAIDANSALPDDGHPHPAYRVAVTNQQPALPVDQPRLQAAVESVLEDSAFQTASISVAVVDDPTIHRVNRQFLQHDYPTDVLSFTLEAEAGHLVGELIASGDTARSNASEYGWSAAEELLLYIVHGTLHLVGYEDELLPQRKAMQLAEAHHLQKLGVVLPADDRRWQHDQKSPSTPGEVRAS